MTTDGVDTVPANTHWVAELGELWSRSTPCTAEVSASCARWIEDEAELLDKADYPTWQSLWEIDGHYWVPASRTQSDPERTVSLIWDDHAALVRRVARMAGNLAFALQQPSAHTCRLIGNVRSRVTPDGLVIVRSKFVLAQYRRGAPEVMGGEVTHVLRTRSGGYGMHLKRVDLVGVGAALKTFATLL